MSTLLIAYDYFHPAWRAGGIIRSLVSLVDQMAGSARVHVVCRHGDLGVQGGLPGVPAGRWVPYGEGKALVYYAAERQASLDWWVQVMQALQPDMVYVNGMFSWAFNVLPLLAAKRYGKAEVCLAPRGMLQEGALAQKAVKKRVFMGLARMAGLYSGVVWHATDAREAEDIRHHFPGKRPIHRIRVIPDTPVMAHKHGGKQRQGNRLVTLSLIAPKKNQHAALEAVRDLPPLAAQLVYHLYGPIADQAYWKRCEALLNAMPPHVEARYMGAVPPERVGEVLAGYDFFVLPTLGENFGHAIAEALGAGTPVLTSPHTPWHALEQRGGGRIVDPRDAAGLRAALLDMLDMDEGAYEVMSAGAVRCLQDLTDQRERIIGQYRQMLLP